MKRKAMFNTVLSTTLLFTIAGTATIAAASFDEPAVKEAQAATDYDAKAVAIIEKSIEASGGKELIEIATSAHTTGTINIPMAGLSGTMETFVAEGGNLLIKVDIPGFGEQLQGLHDGIGWSMDPMNGPKLLEDEMVTTLIEQSDPQASLNYKELYSSITYVGETEFNSQMTHQLDLVSNSTGKDATQYYNIETGLLAGSINIAMTEMGEMKVTSTITEYKEYGGIMMPSKTTESMGPMNFFSTTDSAEFNNVDMSIFALPDAIVALVEATKEDAEHADAADPMDD